MNRKYLLFIYLVILLIYMVLAVQISVHKYSIMARKAGDTFQMSDYFKRQEIHLLPFVPLQLGRPGLIFFLATVGAAAFGILKNQNKLLVRLSIALVVFYFFISYFFVSGGLN